MSELLSGASQKLRELSHLRYDNEVISFAYQEALTDTVRGNVIMLPGLGDSVNPYDPALDTFAEHGYRVAKIAGPHGDGLPKLPRFKESSITQQAVESVWLAKDLLFPDEDESVYLFGPSHGGAIALRAALKRPDEVSGVIMLNPAVCPPGSTFPEYFKRYFGNSISTFFQGDSESKFGSWNVAHRVLTTPIKSFSSGIATVTDHDLPGIPFQLAEHNVKTVTILGSEDPLFIPEETKACIIDAFFTAYTAKLKDGHVFPPSFHAMFPEFLSEQGGHYLGGSGDAYAELGIKAISRIGTKETRGRQKGREVVVFDEKRQ